MSRRDFLDRPNANPTHRVPTQILLLVALVASLGQAAGAGPEETLTNIGFQVEYVFGVSDRFILFEVNEAKQGMDLNGDGRIGRRILHVFDKATGVTTGLGVRLFHNRFFVRWKFDENLLVYLVREMAEEADLNGDGDVRDQVLHVFDADSGEVTNLGWAVEPGEYEFLEHGTSSMLRRLSWLASCPNRRMGGRISTATVT